MAKFSIAHKRWAYSPKPKSAKVNGKLSRKGKKNLQASVRGKLLMVNVSKHKTAPNPLKMDPTRMFTLRRQFSAEFDKRFEALKAAVTDLVVKEDAFGLSQTTNVFCPTGEGGGVDPSCGKQARAAKGGEYGPNGEWYKAGAWIATTEMPKKQREKLEKSAKGTVEIEPGKRVVPDPGKLAIYDVLRPGVYLDPRTMELNDHGMAYSQFSNDQVKQAGELLDKYKSGERQVPLANYWEFATYKDLARTALAKYPIPDEALSRMAKWRNETVETLKGNLGLGPYQRKTTSNTELVTHGGPGSGNFGHGGRPGEVGGSGSGSKTDSPEFKKWFGNSKIVDADGKPLVVFHGTNYDQEIDKFESHHPTTVMRVDGQEAKIVNSWDLAPKSQGNPDGYHYGAVSDVKMMGAEKALQMRLDDAERLKGFYKEEGREDYKMGADTLRHVEDLRRLVGKEVSFSEESRPTGSGTYFTPDPGYSFIDRGHAVYPVYLSIKNPVYLNHGEIESAGYDFNVKKYRDQGYDGAMAVTDKNDITKGGWNGSTQIIAFDKGQIKSSTGHSSRDYSTDSILNANPNHDNQGRFASNPMYDAMRKVEIGADRGALVSIRDLRKQFVGMTKGEFDQVMLAYAKLGQVSLHRHDYVAPLSTEELATDTVYDKRFDDGGTGDHAKGTYYIGAAIRQPETDSGLTLHGGPGSGNFGHTGREGEVGGSGSSSGTKQTDTPEFKQWFAGSVVTHDGGKPLVVYHGVKSGNGTWKDSDVFDPKQGEIGTHFGTQEIASGFAATQGYGTGNRVYPVYLSMRNPLRVQDPGQWDYTAITDAMLQRGTMTKNDVRQWSNEFHERWKAHDWSKGPYPRNEEIHKLLRDHGYDGVVYLNRREGVNLPKDLKEHTSKLNEMPDYEFKRRVSEATESYIAIDPHQIKSAIGHGSKTYDSESVVNFNPNHDEKGKFSSVTIFRGTGPEGIKEMRPSEEGVHGPGIYFYDTTNDAKAYAERGGGIIVASVPREHAQIHTFKTTNLAGQPREYSVIVVQDSKHITQHGIVPTDKTSSQREIDAEVSRILRPTANTRFQFHSTPEKVIAFRKWLAQQVQYHIIGVTQDQINDAWWKQYIQQGFEKGAGRAFSDVRKPIRDTAEEGGDVSDFYEGTKSEFLRSSFGQPESIDKVKLTAGRVFSELEGVTDAMSQNITRTLTDGLVQGKHPRDIAKDIAENVDNIGIKRARMIASTEITRSHGQGQLMAMRRLGVEKLGVLAEFSTSGQSNVCPICAELEGNTYTLDEAEGMIPMHVFCHCAWLPAGVGEDDKDSEDTDTDEDDDERGDEELTAIGDAAEDKEEADEDEELENNQTANFNPSHDEKGKFSSAAVHDVVSEMDHKSAEILLSQGVRPDFKRDRMVTEYAPGAGLERGGLYVSKEGASSKGSFGNVRLHLSVPEENLEVPQEMKQLGYAKGREVAGEESLDYVMRTENGAVTTGELPPSAFNKVEVYRDGKWETKTPANYLKDRGVSDIGRLPSAGDYESVVRKNADKWFLGEDKIQQTVSDYNRAGLREKHELASMLTENYLVTHGGLGSGNFGHSGREGEVGGSSDGATSTLTGEHDDQEQSRGSGSTASKASEGIGRESGRFRREIGWMEPSSIAAAIKSTEVSTEPLTGLPRSVTVPGLGKIECGPFTTGRQAAAAYCKAVGIDYKPPTEYVKVDTERAAKIANEYDKMQHNPHDPATKESYDAMMKETLDQYQFVKATGLKVDLITDDHDPYAASPRLATEDVRRNNHLWVYPTSTGFGSNDKFNANANPLLSPTSETISGKTACVNDIFRIAHDYFGHIKEGFGFRVDGEENAWRSHSAMYSDLARKAMTSETRGQNSWVNYGPHGEANRTASSGTTVFADQKTGLLPDWVVSEGSGHGLVQNWNTVLGWYLADNVFCATGDGGGVDPSCGKGNSVPTSATELLKHASDVKFTDDVIDGSGVEIGRHDYDAIEGVMTSEELDDMNTSLQEMQDSAIDDYIDNQDRDADINEREVAEGAGYSQEDVRDGVTDLVNEHVEDEEENERLLGLVDSKYDELPARVYGLDAFDELNNALGPVPRPLQDALDEYREIADTKIEEARDTAIEQWKDSRREDLINDYDSSSDRHEYLYQFQRDHKDETRFTGGPEDRVEGIWGKDSDGDRVYNFSTKSGTEYQIDAYERDSYGLGKVTNIAFNDADGKYEITGSGNALDVFRNVSSAVAAFANKEKPDVMAFTAAEPSRQKLYDRLVKTVAKSVPDYAAIGITRGGGGVKQYIVAKRDKMPDVIDKAKDLSAGLPYTLDVLANAAIEIEHIEPEFDPKWFTEVAWKDFDKPVYNVFCATGVGGGIDSSCGAHPGSEHGSSVTVKLTKKRAFNGEPVELKTQLTKQETGRVGEAVALAYLRDIKGFMDAKPMNTAKSNFPIDLIEDHAPTEIKAGLASNSAKAQQWRLTFSKESKSEKAAYEKMSLKERTTWNHHKQERIRERKEAVLKQIQKETGMKAKPRTITTIINPDTKTADIYVFKGFHDRIGFNSDQARAAYVGSVTYAAK